MSEVALDRARDVSIEAARAAGALLIDRIDSIREVRHKSAIDLVTDVDVLSEQLVSSRLLAEFPTHTILGEESGTRMGHDERYRWIVDPLDGTTNYTHGFPLYCVSIGFEIDGHMALGVAYVPSLDELFVAQANGGATLNGRPIHVSSTPILRQSMLATGFPYDRARLPRALRSFSELSQQSQSVRRVGSAVLDLCYVACGRFDGYWEHDVKPWDMAAGALMVREAGGTLSGTDGSAFSIDSGQVLASNTRLHPALLEALAGI